MKRTLGSAMIMVALLTSGCEGIRLMTTKVVVECTQESTSTRDKAIAKETESDKEDDKEDTDQSQLPRMPRKTPDKKTSSAGSDYQSAPGFPLQVRFALPVDHSADVSCLANDREVAAISQFTDGSCWAASAEAVMRFHDTPRKMDTSQCNILDAMANEGEVDENTSCCIKDNEMNGTCQQNGLPEQAFKKFGFTWRKLDVVRKGSLEPEHIIAQICQNGPFILVLHYTKNGRLSGGGHSLVVGDYVELGDNFYVWVHDHSYKDDVNHNRVPTPFELWSYDDYIDARWAGDTTHQHSFDYVQIHPPQ